MARSDSSDSEGSSRKHSKSRKRNKQHSRSDSSSSEERNRKSKKSKSDRRRSRSRERKRSRSRERKKSRSRSRDRKRSRSRSRDRRRSHSRDRKKNRSRSRERKRSRSRSLERKKNRSHDRHRSRSRSRSRGSRSLSKEKYRKAKEKSVTPPLKQFFSGREDSGKLHPKSVTGWDAKATDLDEPITDSLSLKEKVKLITGLTNPIETPVMPTAEDIGKIENQNFVQERFSSTYIDPSNQPKQKKKKKNKQKNTQTISVIKDEPIKEERLELISHENAMFGTAADTFHVSRFSSRIDVKRKEELKTVQADDLIFGAMFYDNPEVRMKRWIKKLKTMRERVLEKD